MLHIAIKEAMAPWGAERSLLRSPIIVASFVINVLSLAMPLVVLQVYDRIIPNAATNTFALLLIGLVSAVFLDLLLKMARASLVGWYGAQFEHKAGGLAIEHLMAADLETLEKTPAGAHLDRLAGIDNLRDFYGSQLSAALVDTPFVLLFLGLLWLIAGWLVLVPVLLLAAAIAIAFRISQKLRQALRDRTLWDDRRYNFIIEMLSGIHTIKAVAMEKLILRRYERMMGSAAMAGYRVAFLSGMAQTVGTSFSQLTIATVAGLGSLLAINNDLTIGSLAACTLLAGRTVQPVLNAIGLWSRFQTISIAEQNLNEVAAMPRAADGQTDITAFQKVALNGVSFSYGASAATVLNKVDFSIRPGEVAGVTGGNGCGKTTFLHLLAGRLAPTSGQTLVNQQDLSSVRRTSLQDFVAYLPQRPVLFNGTVLENITMFRNDLYYDEAIDYAERLGLHEVFARLPEGFETRVGDTAAGVLPSGVAQRIAIARALIKKPGLILFDEANTALDSSSDARLRDVLEHCRKQAAIVLVSYRPSLLAMADRRYELRDGHLFIQAASSGRGRKVYQGKVSAQNSDARGQKVAV